MQSQMTMLDPRMIRIKIHLATPSKVLDVVFDYDRDKDSPEGIVEEMRKELGLRNRKQIKCLKQQI